MNWLFPRKQSAQEKNSASLERFITLKMKVDSLPPLTPAAKAEFDHGVDLEHLYYSSKIEGTHLTTAELKRAVNAKPA